MARVGCSGEFVSFSRFFETDGINRSKAPEFESYRLQQGVRSNRPLSRLISGLSKLRHGFTYEILMMDSSLSAAVGAMSCLELSAYMVFRA